MAANPVTGIAYRAEARTPQIDQLQERNIMLKKTLLMTSVSMLAACGGGSGGSDESPVNATEQIVIDATGQAYSAVKIGEGEWQQLPAQRNTLELPGAGSTVTVITVCEQTRDSIASASSRRAIVSKWYIAEVDQRQGGAGYSARTAYCSQLAAQTIEVDLNVVNQDITLIDYDVEGLDSENDNRFSLIPGNDSRTFMAVGYRSSDEKAFLYKRSGLSFQSGDTFELDFTDNTYAQEVSYQTVADKNGFQYYSQYRNPAEDIYLDLNIWGRETNDIAVIPQSLRSAGDLFQIIWSFGEDSSYSRFVSNPDTALELTEAPSEPSLAAFALSQDGTKGVYDYSSYQFDGLTLNRVQAGFSQFVAETSVEISTDYTVYLNSVPSGEVSFPLIDTSELPGFALSFPALTADDINSMRVRYANSSEYSNNIGKRVLSLMHNNQEI